MFREKFTDTEWETITFAPLWTFSAVAGADGKIDGQEMAALGKEISEALLYKDEFTREVLSAIAVSMATIMPAYAHDKRNALEGLEEAARVLDKKMPGGQADAFKRAMLGLGIEVAKASGPMLGDKVSGDEKTAIVLVATLLRVPIPG